MTPTEPVRPTLGLHEAAQAAGVSTRTIRRRIDAGELPNAYREPGPQGAWVLPVDELLAAGFTLHAPAQGIARDVPDELEALRSEVADLRRRAEVAEAVARERAEALADARLALRALTEGRVPAAAQTVAQGPPGPAEHRSAAPDPVPAPTPAPEPAGLIGGLWRRIVG